MMHRGISPALRPGVLTMIDRKIPSPLNEIISIYAITDDLLEAIGHYLTRYQRIFFN